MRGISLIVKRLIGIIENALVPGWGYCYRCKRTWCFTKKHITNYTKKKGCFPLCESCWKVLTPSERIPYYRELWKEWERVNKRDNEYELEEWEIIEKAVLEEK